MSQRLRLSLAAGAVVLAIAAIAGGAVLYLLRPESFTALLERHAKAAGLELALTSPARPSLFPRPGLELEGITLSARDSSAPILLAARGRLVLPWRALLSGPTLIDTLEIDAPRVDVGALQHWLGTLPTSTASGAPALPRIDAGVRIRQGSLVRGDSVLLSDVALDTGVLVDGQPFTIELTARDPNDHPVRLALSAVPHAASGILDFSALTLALAHADAKASLHGEARWAGGTRLALRLSGTLAHPAPDARHAPARYTVALELRPPITDAPLELALDVEGPGTHAQLSLPPVALAQWWNQLTDPQDTTSALGMPPLDGQIHLDALNLGGVHAGGLTIRSGDAVPAAGSSSPQPAYAAPASPTAAPAQSAP